MDYAALLAQVVSTLDGQVTTDQVAGLLSFVEARFNRTINAPEREKTAFQSVTNDVELPADFWQLRDVWLDGSPPVTLEQMSPDAARRLYGTAIGEPVAFVVSNNTLDMFPTPTADSTSVVYIHYQAQIPPLRDIEGETTNWLLSAHPDIYYYSLLLQCEAFIANDERLGTWKSALDEALAELDARSRQRRYGASPLVMRARNYA